MIHAEKCDPPLIISNAILNAFLLAVSFLMQLVIAGYFTFTYVVELSQQPNPNSLLVDLVELKAGVLIVVEIIVLLFLVLVPVASALMGIRRMGNQSGEFMMLYMVLTLVSMVILVILAGISAVTAIYFTYAIFPLSDTIRPADIILQTRFLRIILFSVNALLYLVQPVFRFVTVIASIFVHFTVKINKAIIKRKESKSRKRNTASSAEDSRKHHHHHHRKRGNAILSSDPNSRSAVMPLQLANEKHDSVQSMMQPTLRIDTSKYMLRLEDFKLLEKIGSGGFGSVFKAEYEDSIVALKVLNFDAEKESPDEVAAFIKEFQNEAELLCQLRHPNILFFLGVCMGPKYAIATEFLDMGSLADILHKPDLRREKHIQLTWQLKLKIMIDVSRGVKYLHSMNLIHRDLKPHNILLDKNCVAKVADFGLAKSTNKHLRGISSYVTSFDVSQQMTTFVGSPLWMSPEVILSYNYDNKADVFSFGITMWEVLFEVCPYDNIPLHVLQIAQKVATEGMRPPLLPVPDPDDTHIQTRDLYVQLMQACWMHDPRNRPTMEDVVKELKVILEKADQEASSSNSNSGHSTELSQSVSASSTNFTPNSPTVDSNEFNSAPIQPAPPAAPLATSPAQAQAPETRPTVVPNHPGFVQNQQNFGPNSPVPGPGLARPAFVPHQGAPNTFMPNHPAHVQNQQIHPNFVPFQPAPTHPPVFVQQQQHPNNFAPQGGPFHPAFIQHNPAPNPNQATFVPNHPGFQHHQAPGPNHPTFGPIV